jgi:hypothetical protein
MYVSIGAENKKKKFPTSEEWDKYILKQFIQPRIKHTKKPIVIFLFWRQ